MTLAAPFVSSPMDVIADWIDYNGHLNMAYYNVLFDRGLDQAFEVMGIGVSYARDRKLTIYTAEAHVCYVREPRRAPVARAFKASCSHKSSIEAKLFPFIS
jgi:acyl-CoA thioester hydrolase